MADEKEITEFLLVAKKESYAYENAKEANPFPKLKLIKHESGNWRYVDQYVGGEPFQGLEIVWFKDVPVWAMTYRGDYKGKQDYKLFLQFLKAALRAMPQDAPYRGPKEFESADFPSWKYENKWSGRVKEFKGKEKILFNNKKVYETKYQGGLIGE